MLNIRTAKLLTIGIVAAALTGCASFNGKMVNSSGNLRDCSSAGGGLGLGAIVGVAMAYGSNQSCESSMKKLGYILQTDVGIHGIELDSRFQDEAVVLAAKPPADACLKEDDKIIKINHIENPNLSQTEKELFGKYGESVNIVYQRDVVQNECKIVLLEAD